MKIRKAYAGVDLSTSDYCWTCWIQSFDAANLLIKLAFLVRSWFTYKLNTSIMSNKNERSESNKQNKTPQGAEQSNTIKDPDNWTTGDEQMTGAQRSYLNTLSQEAGEELNEELTKAEASKKIDELQHKTGRGLDQ